MSIAITHNKIATAPDQPDAEINKAEWNDNHKILASVPNAAVFADSSGELAQAPLTYNGANQFVMNNSLQIVASPDTGTAFYGYNESGSLGLGITFDVTGPGINLSASDDTELAGYDPITQNYYFANRKVIVTSLGDALFNSDSVQPLAVTGGGTSKYMVADFNNAAANRMGWMDLDTYEFIVSKDYADNIYYFASDAVRYDMSNHNFLVGNSTASGTYNVVLGDYALATGANDIAIGAAQATGGNSLALGPGSVSSADSDIAIGGGTASGGNSVAIGIFGAATGYGSINLGSGGAAGTNAIALNGLALGDYSLAAGASSANGNFSFAGNFAIAYSYAETAIGGYATTYTPASTTSWDTSDRLFVVGSGASPSARSDAFIIYKDESAEFGGQVDVVGDFSAATTGGGSGGFQSIDPFWGFPAVRLTDASRFSGYIIPTPTTWSSDHYYTLPDTDGQLALYGDWNTGVFGTVPLAKITPGGTNGSLTVAQGLITSITNPT